jgi:hypothetical protein
MNNKANDEKIKKVIRILRISGSLFIILGFVLWSNAFGLSSYLNLVSGGINAMLGLVLIGVGLMDVFVLPRLIDKRRNKSL